MKSEQLISDNVQEVHETFQGYTIRAYQRVNELATNYLKFVERYNTPLHQTDINELERQLRKACEETDLVRKVILNSSSRIRRLITENDFERMAKFAWDIQNIVEDKLQRILHHSSRQVKHFQKTFSALERVDVAHTLRYQEKLAILEIAAIERDAAINRKRLKIMALTKRRRRALSALEPEMAEYMRFWNQKGMPILVEGGYSDDIDLEHPALYNNLPWDKPHPFAAKLGRLVLEHSVMNRVRYADRVHEIVSDFLEEEAELVRRFHEWYGIKNMYRPAKLEEFLADRRIS